MLLALAEAVLGRGLGVAAILRALVYSAATPAH